MNLNADELRILADMTVRLTEVELKSKGFIDVDVYALDLLRQLVCMFEPGRVMAKADNANGAAMESIPLDAALADAFKRQNETMDWLVHQRPGGEREGDDKKRMGTVEFIPDKDEKDERPRVLKDMAREWNGEGPLTAADIETISQFGAGAALRTQQAGEGL